METQGVVGNISERSALQSVLSAVDWMRENGRPVPSVLHIAVLKAEAIVAIVDLKRERECRARCVI